MNPWVVAVGVFVAAALGDMAWARWSQAVRDRRPLAAANYSVALAAFGSAGLVAALTVSLWMLLASLAGYWVGTYGAVWADRKAAALVPNPLPPPHW